MSDKIKVGQELYIIPVGNLVRPYGKNVRKGVVTKVGRKYLYVEIEGVYCGEDGARFNKKTCAVNQSTVLLGWHFVQCRKLKTEKKSAGFMMNFGNSLGGAARAENLLLNN